VSIVLKLLWTGAEHKMRATPQLKRVSHKSDDIFRFFFPRYYFTLDGEFLSEFARSKFKGGLTPSQQLATCCLQHFLVMLPVTTKKMLQATCCQLLPWCKAALTDKTIQNVYHMFRSTL
jgi:hypothetical protein